VSAGRRPSWARIAAFAALTLGALGGAGVYLAKALHRVDATVAASISPPAPSSPAPAAPAPTNARDAGRPATARPRPEASGAAAPHVQPSAPNPPRAPREQAAAVTPGAEAPPSLMFRITALGETYGRLGVAGLSEPHRPPQATPLYCERLHFGADRGVCLTAERRMFARYGAVIFDTAFQHQHQPLRLAGAPSRVRVAPDGRYAAITVFVSGHSYAASNFSTRTSFIDLRTGDLVVEDMESFAVWRDGERLHGVDFNFWGVTFARDGNRFYATLGTGGQSYLVDGDLARRQARVLRAGVECPALSPDNTRVAFKKRTGGFVTAVAWRLSVLDLATGKEWELAETRSVDDQVEWLDDQQLLYGLLAAPSGTAVTNVWVVPADGGGSPHLLVPGAASPVVVRLARQAG
jgi:hypothetical protein